MRRFYTNEEIEIMKNMLDKGYSYTDIGKKVNRSRKSVRNKLVNIGYTQPKFTLNKEYVYEVGQIVNETLKIIKQTKNDVDNMKSYVVQSLTYPEAPLYTLKERSLMNGVRDSYLPSGGRVFEGNSLYSNIEARDYIVDVEYSKTVSAHSNVKMLFKCPYCKTSKKMTPNKFMMGGIRCQRCSSNSYYPELLFSSINDVKQLGFSTQQTFSDLPHRRFDFVNYNTRTIVETHGIQHYKDNGFMDFDRIRQSDEEKRNYCKDKGWLLIELDCRKSDLDYIINNINDCLYLPAINDDEKENIIKYLEYNKRYDIESITQMYKEGISTQEIGRKHNLHRSTISNILKRNGVKLTKQTEKFRCINTGVVFNSLKEVNEWLGKNDKGRIRENIRGEREYAYLHPKTGEKLRWENIEG